MGILRELIMKYCRVRRSSPGGCDKIITLLGKLTRNKKNEVALISDGLLIERMHRKHQSELAKWINMSKGYEVKWNTFADVLEFLSH